jgi:type VI secretion system protein ImpF
MARTITHSLLDRLIDEDPDQAIEPAQTDAQALEHYKAGLRRDLEALLNSKRADVPAVERYEGLDRSVVAFGIADISTEDLATQGARDRVRRMVAQAIRVHETRLTQVDVEIDDGPSSSGIRLRISAQLSLTKGRDSVVYEAKVRPGDRAIAVSLTG